MPATLHLNAFGREIAEAFGQTPYLVGSAAVGKEWRDVDVRLMLPDEQFDRLFPEHGKPDRTDGLWCLLCASIAELGRQRTGLPIDFQIQRRSDANAQYGGERHALGLYFSRGHDTLLAAPADLSAAATLERAHDAVGFISSDQLSRDSGEPQP
ncbi:hypothetical protein [Streptomyces sp. NPDC046978]|uniref:hypothetical protein n=1 Tax=Streptomyces sp. NPDC046978 TaxID=3154704 RepID=UPI0033DB0E8A